MHSLSDALLSRWKTLDESWRFAILLFAGFRTLYALWSWAILLLQPLAVQNIYWAKEPVVTIFDARDSQAYTYARQVDGRSLTFRPADGDAVTDLETGTFWQASTGVAIRGPYQGARLEAGTAAPSVIFPYHDVRPFPLAWLALWQRFDANWYLAIAQYGYGSIAGDLHFPPLYPVMIRLVEPLTGHAFLAALLISHTAALYMLKLLYDAFVEWHGRQPARYALLFLLVFPTAFFFFSAYTESLFLVTVLLSFREMKRQSWGWSGFWAFCAILTRLQGVVLLLPMLYLMWREGRLLRRPGHWSGLGLAALAGLVYISLRSTHAALQVVPLAEPELHARLGTPWQSFGYAIRTILSGQFAFVDVLNLATATLFLVLLIAGWRRIPLEYNLYAAATLLVLVVRIVDTQPLNSMSRYALTLFPAFLTLGLAAEHPGVRRLVIYAFVPLNLYLSAQFFLWGWVA